MLMKTMLIPGVLALLLGACSLQAVEPDEVREILATTMPNLRVATVEKSRLPGFYEIALKNGTVIQFAEDGKYMVQGDLYSLEGSAGVNLSESTRNMRRMQLLDDIDESEMIVFRPEGEVKRSITIFTDIDCGFCRKQHLEVPELNRMGIAVRYLAYPRSGILDRSGSGAHTSSYKKLASAWCADNPQEALTMAKSGQKIEELDCENPVSAQYALGKALKVTGTPTILYDDGRKVVGYRNAARLGTALGVN
jgi:thiol:disulfide interchange protein DsbC